MVLRMNSTEYIKPTRKTQKYFKISIFCYILILVIILGIIFLELNEIIGVILTLTSFGFSMVLGFKGLSLWKKIEQENTYLRMERYIKETDTIIAKLYYLYLEDDLNQYFQSFSQQIAYYPYILTEEFEICLNDCEKETTIRLSQHDFKTLLTYEVYSKAKKENLFEETKKIFIADECPLDELLKIIRKISNNT